jgi:hypothetical protein
MNENDWIKFRTKSEVKFKTITHEEGYGFQIQNGTKWNHGLDISEIEELEKHFGFKFPTDYVEQLKAFNGFETPHISIDPDGEEADEFDRSCYQYPADIEKTKWLIDVVNQYIVSAKETLDLAGFDSTQIEGFIPLYGHRALAVFRDKTKSPVLSIWGDDIIIYGESLIEYWHNELLVN